MAKITLKGLTPRWHVHIHAAELDAEATVPESGIVEFTVDKNFHAIMAQGVTWLDPSEATEDNPGSGEGGLSLPRKIDAGDIVELGW